MGICTQAGAQRFAPSGTRWYFNLMGDPAQPMVPLDYNVSEVLGDTVIGGYTYQQIRGSFGGLRPLWMRRSEDSVFFNQGGTDYFSYHYNLQQGDTMMGYCLFDISQMYDSVGLIKIVADTAWSETWNGQQLRHIGYRMTDSRLLKKVQLHLVEYGGAGLDLPLRDYAGNMIMKENRFLRCMELKGHTYKSRWPLDCDVQKSPPKGIAQAGEQYRWGPDAAP